MGCSASKSNHNNILLTVDDSIHAMLKRECKRGKPHVYVPRAPHPLLSASEETVETHDDPIIQSREVTEYEYLSDESLDRLLRHAEHHNDDLDARDVREYGGR